MTNFDNGFNPKKYKRHTAKAVRNFKSNSTVVKHNAMQEKDGRSSSEWTTRVMKPTKSKPKSMTYGGTKGGKGATIYVKKAKNK